VKIIYVYPETGKVTILKEWCLEIQKHRTGRTSPGVPHTLKHSLHDTVTVRDLLH